jgi:hypothetical protein
MRGRLLTTRDFCGLVETEPFTGNAKVRFKVVSEKGAAPYGETKLDPSQGAPSPVVE